jgi:diguanylate cyclase (GGDEF)-like protein/PAS domain S-box-containing protein
MPAIQHSIHQNQDHFEKKNLNYGLLLAFIYITTGKLGLMLALPPGYASPVFPPAGIAVAAALIGGKKSLPWIFLGSFSLNVWTGYSSSQQIQTIMLAMATIIAFASLLQAAIGGWILRKTTGVPTPLDNVGDVLRFLLFSPVICLTSSSISVGGLLAFNLIETTNIAVTWTTWWVGDTLGLVVMLPLTMTVAGSPRALWRARLSTVAVPLLAVFLFFVAMYLKVNQWEYSASLSDFRQYSHQMTIQLQTKLEEQESLSEQLASLFLLSEDDVKVSRKRFKHFVKKSLTRFPMIQAVSWVPKVNATERATFELSQRRDIPDFEIFERNGTGEIQTASIRDWYYPVTYIEPIVGNKPALGFDLSSNSQRLDAINKAQKTGILVASAPLKLVQERENQAGVLLLLAIDPLRQDTGVVSTVLRMGNFMEKLLPDLREMIFTRLVDLDEQKTLHDNFESETSKVFYTHSFSFGTRNYRLETSPTPAYFEQHHGWQSWWVLAISILSTGLLGSLLLIGTGYTARVESQVEDRTHKLKESEYRWKFALEGSGDGVWDWDITQNKVFFSRRWKELLGFAEQEIGNSHTEWEKRIHPNDKTEVMYAAQACLDGRSASYVSEHRMACKDGSWKWILDRGMVVSRGMNGRPLRLIGTQTDITERKLNEQLVKRMAHYDALTELPNRILFSDRLQHGLVRAKRDQAILSLMFIDLDRFKPINDEFGHHIGDLLLKAVAKRLKSCLRKSDTVARIGGDEFVVLLPVVKVGRDALLIAEKICENLNQPFNIDTFSLNISSSIGVTIYPEHGTEDTQLMKNADIAMYHAKKGGRNNVAMYQPYMESYAVTS